MRISAFVLIFLALSVFAADRVVLFGDFSTVLCSACAGSAASVNNFVEGYLANDQMSPFTWFLNGPGAKGLNTHLWNTYWTTGYVPTFVADGVYVSAGWNQSVWKNHVDARLAVPAYLKIEAEIVGDASGGTVTYTLTAEQALGDTLKLYSAILQSNQIGGTGWGLFDGKVLHHIPVAIPCGSTGTPISFTGPYPQTIQVVKTYTLNPVVNIFDNLDLASFVLDTSTKEAMNAHFMDVPDTNTGVYIEGESGSAVVSSGVLTVWPNPTSSTFTVSSLVPDGTTGTVEVFDIAGRSVGRFDAGSIHSMTIEEAGVYFLQLTTSTGEIVRKQIAVIR